jgi:hypothetical protein
MRIERAGLVGLLAIATAGCSIAAPLYDRQMADADHQACAPINAPPAAGETSCFNLFEEDSSGRRAWSGGALTPGRTLIAVHNPAAPGCAARHSHLTVTGAAPGGGRMELAVWDGMARAGHSRVATWGTGFPRRTLALAGIDHVTLMPAGARVRMLEGSFDPASLCFKGY